MSRKYFGTDGVRGRVGQTPITPEFAMLLAQAAGRILKQQTTDGEVGVFIGKDTRVSGYMLEAALQAGFLSAGVDVMLGGCCLSHKSTETECRCCHLRLS